LWTAPFGGWGLGRSSFARGSLIAVAVLGAVGTGIAFVLMGRLVSRVGSTRAAFANYLIPVVAMLLGAVFRNETIRATSVVGIVLVIGGRSWPRDARRSPLSPGFVDGLPCAKALEREGGERQSLATCSSQVRLLCPR
jgi:threonine/homoserine efflux transporter RhtA